MYVIDLRTEHVIDLGWGDLCHGASRITWAPTEPQFLRWGQTFGLELVSAVDGNTQQLVSGGAWPAWSLDGRQVAYIHEGGVWLMNLADMSTEPLTHISPSDPEKRGQRAPYIYDKGPQWSPAGSAIAFVAFRGDHPEAYLIEVAE
jgi:hypothetical protein